MCSNSSLAMSLVDKGSVVSQKQYRLCNETHLALNPSSTIFHSVILDRSFQLTKPQFLHQQNGNNNTFFTVLLWGVINKYEQFGAQYIPSCITHEVFNKYLLNSCTVSQRCGLSVFLPAWHPIVQHSDFLLGTITPSLAVQVVELQLTIRPIPQFRIFHPPGHKYQL